jgi:DNA gyrase/topoisomerase IV subunit A
LDTFSSVTSGLGIIGQGIEAGELDLPVYTPDKLAYTALDMPHSRPNVSAINLDIMQRRIAVAEGAVEAGVTDADLGLVVVDEAGVVTAVPLESSRLQQADPIPLTQLAADLQIAKLDDQLLLITSKYRFLLISPRQLLELQDMELAITNLHQFEKNEKIVSLNNWTQLKRHQRLLLVTSTSYARPYPLDVLIPSVEAPVPLKFDQPLPGVVVAVRGLNGDEGELVLVTRTGKAARFAQSILRTSGVQLLNLGTVLDDRVNGVTLAQPDDELVVVTADGYGRLLCTHWLDAPDRLNAKPKSIISRRSDVVGIGREEDWVVTSLWLSQLSDMNIPLENATKTYPIMDLQPDETIQLVCAVV